jgi:hypothetical protein
MYYFSHKTSRPKTSELLDLVNTGLLDATTALKACLEWMSEQEVAEMAELNNFLRDPYGDES